MKQYVSDIVAYISLFPAAFHLLHLNRLFCWLLVCVALSGLHLSVWRWRISPSHRSTIEQPHCDCDQCGSWLTQPAKLPIPATFVTVLLGFLMAIERLDIRRLLAMMVGGGAGCVEEATAMEEFSIDPKNGKWPRKERIIISTNKDSLWSSPVFNSDRAKLKKIQKF